MIGTKSEQVEAFWRQSLEAEDIQAEDYHAYTFADPAFSTRVGEIAELARSGKKRGTSHLRLDFEVNRIPIREAGDFWVVLGDSCLPLCVIRLTKVSIKPFNEVDAAFAASEGEGDLSLEGWANAHRRYFQKQLAKWQLEWREDLPTVCESFELVFPVPDGYS